MISGDVSSSCRAATPMTIASARRRSGPQQGPPAAVVGNGSAQHNAVVEQQRAPNCSDHGHRHQNVSHPSTSHTMGLKRKDSDYSQNPYLGIGGNLWGSTGVLYFFIASSLI
jgi:hypothetical protein